ncbi:metaxin-3-like [Coccinella septempunctata]|uniref:metaxin-3-like n=1 Tax=Coccinella septempunctata TaxID=41139 RepID=UPI001D078659|nr:metaxin-3-like [Coccinella septempunctata]
MANETVEFRLNVVPGDFGLVSLDPECIQSILYTRIAKVPCEVRFSDSYKVCTLFSTPSLVDGKKVLKGNQEITQYLRSKNYNIDFGLNGMKCSTTMAITSLVQEKIRPLLEFVMWIDKRNAEELIIPWHMKVLRLPFNYFYTNRHKKDAENLIETMYPYEDNPEVIKDYLNKAATEAFSSLSSLLGEKDYYFEHSPTSLDILVYAYLAPFIKLPFVSVDIGNMFTNLWPNLEKFVKRIDAKFMPDLTDNARNVIQSERNLVNDEEVSISAVIILSVSAVTLVMTFIVQRGFFRLR